jgi:hypothetical protein
MDCPVSGLVLVCVQAHASEPVSFKLSSWRLDGGPVARGKLPVSMQHPYDAEKKHSRGEHPVKPQDPPTLLLMMLPISQTDFPSLSPPQESQYLA